jgi:single-strand DNA-binding protein
MTMKHKTFIKMTGFVTKEPDLRRSTSGYPVCTIRMGVSDRFLDRSTGEWRDDEPSYYDVTCWRRLAENVTFSLRKGDIITIHGTFRVKTWVDRNNNPRHELDITADAVAHEMAFGTSRYLRTGRQQGAEEREGQAEANRQDLDPASAGFGAGTDDFGSGDHLEDSPFPGDEFADTDLMIGASGDAGTSGEANVLDSVGPPPPDGAPEAGAPEVAEEQRPEDAAVPV